MAKQTTITPEIEDSKKMFSVVVLEKAYKSIERAIRTIDTDIGKVNERLTELNGKKAKETKKLNELQDVLGNLQALEKI